MLEFAKWVTADADRFLMTLLFIGAVCWFISWPLAALRSGKHDD